MESSFSFLIMYFLRCLTVTFAEVRMKGLLSSLSLSDFSLQYMRANSRMREQNAFHLDATRNRLHHCTHVSGHLLWSHCSMTELLLCLTQVRGDLQSQHTGTGIIEWHVVLFAVLFFGFEIPLYYIGKDLIDYQLQMRIRPVWWRKKWGQIIPTNTLLHHFERIVGQANSALRTLSRTCMHCLEYAALANCLLNQWGKYNQSFTGVHAFLESVGIAKIAHANRTHKIVIQGVGVKRDL